MTIAQMQAGMASGQFQSIDLVNFLSEPPPDA
jgi:hypothetical protein